MVNLWVASSGGVGHHRSSRLDAKRLRARIEKPRTPTLGKTFRPWRFLVATALGVKASQHGRDSRNCQDPLGLFSLRSLWRTYECLQAATVAIPTAEKSVVGQGIRV